MKRRQLLSTTAAAAASQLAPGAAALNAAPARRAMMKLGCQSSPTSDQRLQFFARHGVQGICGYPQDSEKKGFFSVEDLSRIKDRCEKYKIDLDCIEPGFLASTHVDKAARPAIMLGKSPERDHDIECVQNTIRSCAKVGIPTIKYNMNLLGVLRTGRTPGRGGTTYSTWNLKEAKTSGKFTPETRAGRVDADLYWERITYFLERVIPVANEF